MIKASSMADYIGKNMSERKNPEMIKMNMVWGDDDIILIKMKRDLVTDNCSENTKMMVDESLKCSRK